MKKKNHSKQAFVDKVLERLEKDRYQANPFLYTRIKEQLQDRGTPENQRIWSPQLVWKLSLASLLIAVNLYTFFSVKGSSGETDIVNTFMEEYSWTVNETDNIYYLNLE